MQHAVSATVSGMSDKLNDTRGTITSEEHAQLRAAASPCLHCGMLADVDPVLHAARYGHAPSYRDRDGRILTWLPQARCWTAAGA